ncbi:MAG: PPC domain-containing protein [Pseudomonadota bacterium]
MKNIPYVLYLTLILISSCSNPKINWTRKINNSEDRSRLFSTFGSTSLDASLAKPDLIWGHGSELSSGLKLARKEEFVLATCYPPFGKIVTDYGNLTIKQKKVCVEEAAIEEVLISSSQGGKTPAVALNIPTGEANYLVYDKIDRQHNEKWYKFHSERDGTMEVILNSEKILMGKLFRDGNRDQKMESTELVDIMNVDQSPQKISLKINQADYYFSILYDDEAAEYSLNFKYFPSSQMEDKGGATPEDAFFVEILADETKLTDYVSDEDPIDFFSFTLKETSNLKIKMERTFGNGDADLTLYHDINEDGLLSEAEIVGLSEGSGTEYLAVDSAPQGKWYLKVNQFNGALGYSLNFRVQQSESTDLDLQVKKQDGILNVSVKNLGPSGADDVVLIITKNSLTEISSLQGPLKKIDDLHYSLNLNHIAAKDEASVTLTGKSEEMVTLEVLSKFKDPNPSNNATAVFY